MNIIGRITLLGLFATVGIALAIGTSFSTVPSSPYGSIEFPEDEKQPEPSASVAEEPPSSVPAAGELAAGELAVSELAEGDLAQPHVLPAASSPSPVFVPVPIGPLEVQPNPLLAQQAVAEGLEQVLDLVRQRLAPPAAPPIQAAPAVSAGQPLADDSPGTPTPTAAASQLVLKSTVIGEGDGRLSITIPDEPIRDVLELLSRHGNLNILASKSVQGNVSATLTNVDLISALDAILKSTGYVAKREGDFIFVGTAEEFQLMEQAMDKIATRVYRPNYITAAELQGLITPLLSEKVGVVSISSPAETGIGADDSQVGGDAFAGAEVLVVRDYEAVLAEIDQMLDQVDVRPLQVSIEAMILSVKLDDENKLGVDFGFLRNNDNLRFGLGKPPNGLPTALSAGGLQFAFIDTNFSAFVNALEEIQDVNVIATPRLMVLNKHRAVIQIGRQEGYVNTTATETSTTQSVEFLDTGTLLRLRPFISSDGMIRMEIHPELSSGEVKLKGGFTVPEKEVTQVTTNIMVRDGCTVLIGGLIREELVSKPTQVPLLGSLPLVGLIFRSTTEETIREEIIVLVTPRIVHEPDAYYEGDHAASEFHRRQNLFADKMMPTSKTYVGRKYFRLARSAWAAGDRDTALRFAEMSVHFDPMNRAAIDLRSDIWQGRRYGEHTLNAAGSPLGPMDGEVIAPWLLDDLQREPTSGGPRE